MPKVYDWNGTAASEIKKIYDWNGSAATQIQKGYDHDGTASSLIYSAEEYLVGSKGNNSAKISSTNAERNWYGNPINITWTTSFNASGFHTLYFDLQADYIWYVNPDNSNYYVNSVCKFGFSKSAISTGSRWNTSNAYRMLTHTTKGKRNTWAINIADQTGVIYPFVGICIGGGGISEYVHIYNIWAV